MIRHNSAPVILLAFLGTVCASCGPGYTVQTLPNGKKLKVLQVGPMAMARSSIIHGRAFFLSYQTDLPIKAPTAIVEEEQAIWAALRPVVEQQGFKIAVIKANSPPQWLFLRTVRWLMLKKTAGGDWEIAN